MVEAPPRFAAARRAKLCKEGCPGCKLDEVNRTKTGIPYLNFFYIWLVCLCAALPIQSLFPYLYFMYLHFIFCYVSLGATYFLARAFGSVPWGIFADKYGRKPCIVISILSVIVFNTLFGLSKTYWMAIETLHMYNVYNAEAIDAMEEQVPMSCLKDGEPTNFVSGGGASRKSLLKNMQLMSAIILYCVFSLHDKKIIFSLWTMSSRKYRGLSFTSQDVGIVLVISGLIYLLHWYVNKNLLQHLFNMVNLLYDTKRVLNVQVLSVLLLPTYPFMANLYGIELQVIINVDSLLKNIFAAIITTACNILQNTAVTQEQRGVANGISVTLMSVFKAAGPAIAGILFSWAQKNIAGLFLPGDHILFLSLNMVSVIGLLLTFKTFFSLPNAMK
ncbi:unnamed protein product [Alopecurus aequalis]